jgi:hypothetical protein
MYEERGLPYSKFIGCMRKSLTETQYRGKTKCFRSTLCVVGLLGNTADWYAKQFWYIYIVMQPQIKPAWKKTLALVRRLSAKLVSTFVDRGCRMFCAMDPYSRHSFFQVGLQLYPRGWVDPVNAYRLTYRSSIYHKPWYIGPCTSNLMEGKYCGTVLQFPSCVRIPNTGRKYNVVTVYWWHHGTAVVKALCYKPAGCRFETRWGDWIFPSGRTRPWVSLSL